MLDMLEGWRDGRIKLAIIATLLSYRRNRPKLLAQGGYERLLARGVGAEQICAFAHRDWRTL
jgi:(1->4)-alpha-D-glucan 1-alpha-D-glucosylmutase